MNRPTKRTTRGIVASTRLKRRGDRYHLDAFLWDCAGCMNRALELGGNAAACHHPMRYREIVSKRGKVISRWAGPKLGELHFVRGKWSMEVVVHELVHAALHRLRATVLRPDCDMNKEEEPLCYALGEWGDQVYRWLWKLDGPKKPLTRKSRAR